MRKLILLATVLAVALPAVAARQSAIGTASGWFDMENCAFCKHLTENPGLLDHTTWEGHPLGNGMMYIMTVEPEYAEAMAKAAVGMEKVGAGIQSGQINPMTLQMCGHCQEFGMIMMAGVHMENVKGQAAEVSIFTSDDPALVERMHALVKRDTEEMALMAAKHENHPGNPGKPH